MNSFRVCNVTHNKTNKNGPVYRGRCLFIFILIAGKNMQLKLLDINKFITQNKCLQVKSTSTLMFGKSGNIDPNGLFSEEIFGRIGSMERRKRFGYIDLKTKIIHPEVYNFINGLSSDIYKILLGKVKYSITKDGSLEEDPENGFTGIYEFIKNFDKLDLDKFSKSDGKNNLLIKFLKENKKLIFIDKILVIPAGNRDIQFNKQSGTTNIQYSEISNFYSNLLKQTQMIPDDMEFLDEELVVSIVQNIQKNANDINDWITERIKGKGGVIRGGVRQSSIIEMLNVA